MFIDKESAITKMNRWGEAKTPFLMIADYRCSSIYLKELDSIDPNECLYDFPQQSNIALTNQFIRSAESISPTNQSHWQSHPPSYDSYLQSFTPLMEALKCGEIDLVNLTFPTQIESDFTLKTIFNRTKAKYRIWLKDYFTLFSPETFVTIRDGIIATYPMKGTIDATLPNAENQLLNNPKEIAEHQTVVALAKKELSTVASNIRVSRYRYIDHLASEERSILQSSSLIEGDLPSDYLANIGSILFQLLPAASITGSPKENAIRLIESAESAPRGFYTGVAALFDGENLDSTVLIRIIENQNNQLYFKSGGGITRESNPKDEYAELIQKIYLPLS